MIRELKASLGREQGIQPCGALGYSHSMVNETSDPSALSTCFQTTDFYILNISFSRLCTFGYFEACYMPSF